MDERFGQLGGTDMALPNQIGAKQVLQRDEELSGQATRVFRVLEIEVSDKLKQARQRFLDASVQPATPLTIDE